MAMREESLKRRTERIEELRADMAKIRARHDSYNWKLPCNLPRAKATIVFPTTIEDNKQEESTYKSTKAVGVRFLDTLYKSAQVLYDRINDNEEVSQEEVDALAIRTQRIFSIVESKYQNDHKAVELLAARRISKRTAEVYHKIDKPCPLSQKGFDAVKKL